ncbi:hypothetical protein QTG54_017123 (mitochondrion) [Skeletonema marinoi]|uniref:Uncharacterized protein n=1 Tax=Skeletonema marinoi TaxID=267567 RepID=A0AAD8XQS0_9STRA|nr:hypothetical protein QTG54_017123 [Skeletonema marinoi]
MSSGNSNKKLGKILQHRDMQAILFKFFFAIQKKMFNFNFSENKHRVSFHY